MGTAMSLEFDTDIDSLAQLANLSGRIEKLRDSMDCSKPKQRPECVCCLEHPLPNERINMRCSHFLCSGCLINLVKVSLRDEAMFPPRCCNNTIKVSDAEDLIGLELALRYEKHLVEFEDPDKTYCSDPACSRYISPKKTSGSGGIAESIMCKCKCGITTCKRCKQKAHGFGDCVRHFDKLLDDLAKIEGWQRCPSCSRLIEREKGCDHIT